MKISKIIACYSLNLKAIQRLKKRFLLNPSCQEVPSSSQVLKYTYKLRKTMQAPKNYKTSTPFLPLRFQFNSLAQNKFAVSGLGQTNRSNKLYKQCEIPTITYVNNSQINLQSMKQNSKLESREINKQKLCWK